jgi:hypothetical protein
MQVWEVESGQSPPTKCSVLNSGTKEEVQKLGEFGEELLSQCHGVISPDASRVSKYQRHIGFRQTYDAQLTATEQNNK